MSGNNTGEEMTSEEVNIVASELVREWISTGPDLDYVHDYFNGEADALSITRIHDEACVIAKAKLREYE